MSSIYTSTRLTNMIRIALFAAILSVSAWICIPIFTVPITMQTFAIFSAVFLLGGGKGTLAILLYLALGAIGLPVFSGMSGGIGILLGPNGGYLFGFLLIGLTSTSLSRLLNGWRLSAELGALIGLLLCYTLGTIWLVAIYAAQGERLTLSAALLTAVLPYLIPDLCKFALALSVARTVRRHIR